MYPYINIRQLLFSALSALFNGELAYDRNYYKSAVIFDRLYTKTAPMQIGTMHTGIILITVTTSLLHHQL